MSKFSGKSDLADHIFIRYGEKNNWDLLKCFEDFKKSTNGVLRQHLRIKDINSQNRDFIKANCKNFDYKKHTTRIKDGRTMSGIREKTFYTYVYYGITYSQKEINKKGVFITKEIKFNTLLDLIPYFPYLITTLISENDKDIIYISENSFVTDMENEFLKSGHLCKMAEIYRKELANLYLEVCEKYFLKDLDKRTKFIDISFDNLIKIDQDTYTLKVSNIDYMHDPKYIFKNNICHSIWSNPQIKGNILQLSAIDIENYLREDISNNNLQIKYIEKL